MKQNRNVNRKKIERKQICNKLETGWKLKGNGKETEKTQKRKEKQ